jgi:hypothetical protein
VNKTKPSIRLILLAVGMVLPACQSGASLAPVATPTIVATPPAPVLDTSATAAPPPLPTQYSEFSSLSEVQPAAKFPVWLPQFVPASLPFYKAWISDYVDGRETVRIVYREPGDPLDAKLKTVDVQLTKTDQDLSRDSVTHQFKVEALAVRDVSVRSQAGFTYWTRSGAAGNSASLVWREDGINVSVTLYGDWPQPDEHEPHRLDDTLLKIAESLQTAHGLNTQFEMKQCLMPFSILSRTSLGTTSWTVP